VAASQRWQFKTQKVKFEKMLIFAKLCGRQPAPALMAPEAALVRNLFCRMRAEDLALRRTTLDDAASDDSNSDDYSYALSALRRLLLTLSAAVRGNRNLSRQNSLSSTCRDTCFAKFDKPCAKWSAVLRTDQLQEWL
jgi:hypothetical protein